MDHDYVVVGAGSAGCVLAARLSADPAVRVLLLEAGGCPPPATRVPSAWFDLRGSAADWADTTVVQAVSGTRVDWPHGKGLGGTSSINGMVFARGHRSGYDAWAAAGATGWGFADLLPFFRRTERAEGRDPAVRGTAGPLAVAPAARPHPVAAAALEAAAEVGHPVAGDISSGLEEGFGRVDLNIVDGRRQSAADAYLRPAVGRPNLDVVTGALVHRLRIDGDRCTGVDYSVQDNSFTASCSGEVVLAAGAVGSAQLMLLAGIGPAAHLREVGVDIVVDLPGVGANLHDHLYFPLRYAGAQPVQAGEGNNLEVVGLVRSAPDLEAPDLQIFFSTPPLAGAGCYAIAFALMAPHSRGRLRLAAPAAGRAPLLDPGYLTDDRDVDAMVAGLRIAREIGEADALAPWRGAEVLPGPDVAGDGAARDYLRRNPLSHYHYAGSCRLGTDTEAVVDLELRVHGVRGLRIADASVLPAVPSANPNATVLAVAERAAELIAGSAPP